METENSRIPSLECLNKMTELLTTDVRDANEQLEILQEQLMDYFPEIWNELKDLTIFENIVAYKDKILSANPDNDDLDLFMQGYVDYLKDLQEYQATKSYITSLKRIFYKNHA